MNLVTIIKKNMDLAHIIAIAIALAYIPAGISILAGQVNMEKMMKNFEESEALTFLSGLLMVLAGVFLIEAHNAWVADWTVLITIVGWAILIKGILFLLIPKTFLAFSHKVSMSGKWPGWVVLVLGFVMAYFGFFG
jgi:hypothetical protein